MTVNLNSIEKVLISEINILEAKKAEAQNIIRNVEEQIACKKEQLNALRLLKPLLNNSYEDLENKVGFGLGKRLPEEVKQKMSLAQKARQEKIRRVKTQQIIAYLNNVNSASTKDIAAQLKLTTFFTRKHLIAESNIFKEIALDMWSLK